MYEAHGVTRPATFQAVFRHTADTTRGQSGSPVWTVRGDRLVLLGIVMAYDQQPDQLAVFVHDRLVRRTVEGWMAEDAPKPRRVQRRIALEIPYRWVCRLEVYDNDLKRTVAYGSGLLISDRHVLTSARVIYGFSKDRRRYSVRVAPGYEFGKEAFGAVTAGRGRVSPRFSPDAKDAAADFGLLTLSRPVGSSTFAAIGNARLGSWSDAAHGLAMGSEWSGKPAHIAAYSRASGGGAGYHLLRVSSGAIDGRRGDQVLHKAGARLDAPGAPLWVEVGGRRLLVGITSALFSKDSEINWGCYLGEEARSHLRDWMNEDIDGHEIEVGDELGEAETVSAPDFGDGEGVDADLEPYAGAESANGDFLRGLPSAEVEEGPEAGAGTEQFEPETEDVAGERFEELVPLALPPTAPKLPTDAAMRAKLQAMKTPEARALDAAFASFGDFSKFVSRLPAALKAVSPELAVPAAKYLVYLARLGAEAFIYDAPRMEVDNRYQVWLDYPATNEPLDPQLLENFLHFAVRRLYQIALVAVKPGTHRRQIDRAAALFRFFQQQLRRQYPIGIRSEEVLVAYRKLLVQIIWLHYQRLFDGWMAAAAKSRLPDSIIAGEWPGVLQLAASTDVGDATALVPKFNQTPRQYRDYFDQQAASDIAYKYYTVKPPPAPPPPPDISFAALLRQRQGQKALIEDLRTEAGADPIPNLHDGASWQAWLRKMSDRPVLRRDSELEWSLKLVGRYFKAFTIHVPLDLAEGCREKNYLKRVFPRAATGALVHDCFVYACRWLHMLGRILVAGSKPLGLANLRIYLIEMPAHAGVMIRADSQLSGPLLIGLSNKDAFVERFERDESDAIAAEKVVGLMYRGMKTPYVMRRLSAKPADANALWGELCKLADKKLALPYADPQDPPHLRYLRHNAAVARVSRALTDAVRASWAALLESTQSGKPGGGQPPAGTPRRAIEQHAARFEAAVRAAKEALDKETTPLIAEINADIEAHRDRLAPGTLVVETAGEIPFLGAVQSYRAALKEALQSGAVRTLHPDLFFGDDDFDAVVE